MTAVSSINVTQKNTCPHGLPLGACPICNGMGGGGGRVNDKHTARRSGELTYAQCAAIGARMKAAAEAKEARLEALRAEFNIANLKIQTDKFVEKLQNNLSQIQNSLPPALGRVFGNVVSNVINPLLNFAKNIPNVVQNIANFISEFRGQIISTMEKLTAIVGEVKNFISAKIKEEFKKIKKKILSLFGFYIIESGEDEEILRELGKKEAKKIKNLLLKLFGEEKEDYEHQQPQNGEGEQPKKDRKTKKTRKKNS
ncbi:hypothetical protein IKA92_06870 [bacterium]|nr:hypothetical protein [bacterium]